MTNWGRLFTYHPGSRGSQFHLQQYQSTKDPLERIRHFYMALAANPRETSSLLTSTKMDSLAELTNQTGIHFQNDYWPLLNQTAGLSDTFEFFTDIKPGPNVNEAYVLNRWDKY